MIGVVIPVKNIVTYLEEALMSVEAQTLQPSSIVIVDDGSDIPAQIAESWLNKFNHIHVMRLETSRGLGFARNFGVSHLPNQSIEYIAFLDADDLWPEDRLERLVEAMQSSQKPMAFGQIQNVNQEGRPLTQGLPCRLVNTGLISHETWAQVGGFDETLRVGQPIDFFSKASKVGISYALIDAVTVFRRIHGDNISRTQQSHTSDYLKAVRAHLARRDG